MYVGIMADASQRGRWEVRLVLHSTTVDLGTIDILPRSSFKVTPANAGAWHEEPRMDDAARMLAKVELGAEASKVVEVKIGNPYDAIWSNAPAEEVQA